MTYFFGIVLVDVNEEDNWDWNFTVLLANNSDKLAVGIEFHT